MSREMCWQARLHLAQFPMPCNFSGVTPALRGLATCPTLKEGLFHPTLILLLSVLLLLHPHLTHSPDPGETNPGPSPGRKTCGKASMEQSAGERAPGVPAQPSLRPHTGREEDRASPVLTSESPEGALDLWLPESKQTIPREQT